MDDVLNPELDMINNEIKRLTKKSLEQALTNDDLRKLESLIKMRVIIQDKPTTIYIQDYDHIYDRTALATVRRGERIANPDKIQYSFEGKSKNGKKLGRPKKSLSTQTNSTNINNEAKKTKIKAKK